VNELVKTNDSSINKIVKDNLEDVRSQHSTRSGDGLGSPKKRLERKRGREGRMRSRSKES
jgi:hypothetical protein